MADFGAQPTTMELRLFGMRRQGDRSGAHAFAAIPKIDVHGPMRPHLRRAA